MEHMAGTSVVVDVRDISYLAYDAFVMHCDERGIVYSAEFVRHGQSKATTACITDQRHEYVRAVREYLVSGNSAVLAAIPYRQAGGSEFQAAVYRAMSSIPGGSTCSYKDLASAAGYPGAARAVGTACKKNTLPLLIPCHRVVPAAGGTGNYLYGTAAKEALLRLEGAL